MKFVRKFISSVYFWPLVIVIFFALLAGRYMLLPGYFNMHDDLQMMRQLEMEKCFLDLQIPCRWVPDMGYGFGFPLFNYYPPLPYLIGEIFRLVGFSFVDTVKVAFLLSFVVSGVGMYLLAKEFFGKWGGVVSAIFYIWAPYHSVDVYVRGAMNEAWALAWFPFILWASYKLILEKKRLTKWIITLALFWFALFMSHNLMVLIFTPVFVLWCLLFLYQKRWLGIASLIKSGFLALGLAAFFTLPAFLEQKYVQVDTLVTGYYEYIAHFVSLRQLLISRFWGYGPSVWLELDRMPLQIGHIHWVLSLVLLVFIGYVFVKRRKVKNIIKDPFFIVFVFIIIGWLALFMTHVRSSFFWKLIPLLKFIQFPWRFLTLSTLAFSFVAGFVVKVIPVKLTKYFLVALVVGLIVFNWNYFKPDKGKMGPLTDQEKFSGAAWGLQQTAGIYDYLPKDAVTAPKEPMQNLAEVYAGEVRVEDAHQGTKWASFKVKVSSDEAVIRLGIFKYPIWQVYVDGQKTDIFMVEDEQWGRMSIKVSKGEHDVVAKLRNTPVRLMSNFISLATWAGLIFYLLKKVKGAKNY